MQIRPPVYHTYCPCFNLYVVDSSASGLGVRGWDWKKPTQDIDRTESYTSNCPYYSSNTNERYLLKQTNKYCRPETPVSLANKKRDKKARGVAGQYKKRGKKRHAVARKTENTQKEGHFDQLHWRSCPYHCWLCHCQCHCWAQTENVKESRVQCSKGFTSRYGNQRIVHSWSSVSQENNEKPQQLKHKTSAFHGS